MEVYDLCVAWNWEYDASFIGLLETSCQSSGLKLLQIKPENLPQMLNSLVTGELACRVFFDRASDVDPQFLPLIQWAREDSIPCINSYDRAIYTWNKADLHSLLVKEGYNVPATIILPPYIEFPEIPPKDLIPLGEQFTIKPAHGGGGVGVMTNATSWDQVLRVRQEHATDYYLLQAYINPVILDGRPAWFRVIYCAGTVFSCWWDPATHIYIPVAENEKEAYGLYKLDDLGLSIANVCGLDIFSTEIAFTHEGRFVVVDYVNDQIDLRLQSNTSEGVPDDIVRSITQLLACHVSELV